MSGKLYVLGSSFIKCLSKWQHYNNALSKYKKSIYQKFRTFWKSIEPCLNIVMILRDYYPFRRTKNTEENWKTRKSSNSRFAFTQGEHQSVISYVRTSCLLFTWFLTANCCQYSVLKAATAGSWRTKAHLVPVIGLLWIW